MPDEVRPGSRPTAELGPRPTSSTRVLVTGATGYIGGRLVPRLLDRGALVRCVARDPRRLGDRSWPGAEIVQGDLADRTATERALDGIEVAYYLVHSMASGPTFRERDRTIAQTFGDAARQAGVRRIVYLGGLGDPDKVLSKHLISRHEVG
ncbi:MAG: NAD(P)H-binding protein, partial [Acidimicrobiales bacterium]